MNIKSLKGIYIFVEFVVILFTTAYAQDRPFLFTYINPKTDTSAIVINYDAAYGNKTFEPLGGENIEQAFGVHAGLGKSFTLVTKLGFAFNNASVQSSQHVELLMQVLESKSNMIDLSAGAGLLHEYGGTNVLLARAVVGRRFTRWQIYSNALLEKPFSVNRDAADLFLTFGMSYRISKMIRLGLELVGQDLEGFWEEEEAEGGAVLFFGPTFVATIPDNSWTIILGGGPILRATKSAEANLAPRDLPTTQNNGYIIHAAFNYAL